MHSAAHKAKNPTPWKTSAGIPNLSRRTSRPVEEHIGDDAVWVRLTHRSLEWAWKHRGGLQERGKHVWGSYGVQILAISHPWGKPVSAQGRSMVWTSTTSFEDGSVLEMRGALSGVVIMAALTPREENSLAMSTTGHM